MLQELVRNSVKQLEIHMVIASQMDVRIGLMDVMFALSVIIQFKLVAKIIYVMEEIRDTVWIMFKYLHPLQIYHGIVSVGLTVAILVMLIMVL
tara:strand:- start:17 stop:295 length:279 start_codon:yes stop_codon:yes gene_type:complete